MDLTSQLMLNEVKMETYSPTDTTKSGIEIWGLQLFHASLMGRVTKSSPLLVRYVISDASSVYNVEQSVPISARFNCLGGPILFCVVASAYGW